MWSVENGRAEPTYRSDVGGGTDSCECLHVLCPSPHAHVADCGVFTAGRWLSNAVASADYEYLVKVAVLNATTRQVRGSVVIGIQNPSTALNNVRRELGCRQAIKNGVEHTLSHFMTASSVF